jgi:hypothetical protein
LLFEDDPEFWFETEQLFGAAEYGGALFGDAILGTPLRAGRRRRACAPVADAKDAQLGLLRHRSDGDRRAHGVGSPEGPRTEVVPPTLAVNGHWKLTHLAANQDHFKPKIRAFASDQAAKESPFALARRGSSSSLCHSGLGAE